MLVARTRGFELTRNHLEASHDVVLPHLLLLGEVIDQVEAIAALAGAGFIEVVLVAPAEEILERLASGSGRSPHPRDAFTFDELAGQIDHALSELRSLAAARPGAHCVGCCGMDATAAAVAVAAVIGW